MAFQLPAHTGTNFVPTLHGDIYPAINPLVSDLSQPSKVVLITGAGRGIGRSIALRYAESGVACLALCARTASQLDEVAAAIHNISANVRVRTFPLDVTDDAAVRMVAAAVTADEGRLDVLVNNAGTLPPCKPIGEGDPDDEWATWRINIQGPYLMTRAFLPLLVATAAKTDGGVVDVVNITSTGSHFCSPGCWAYQNSKFALNRLTEFVHTENNARGVNCVAVHPGGVVTEMSRAGPAWLIAQLNDTADLGGGFVVWLTKGRRTWLGGRYASATWDVDELEAKKDEIVTGDKLVFRMVV